MKRIIITNIILFALFFQLDGQTMNKLSVWVNGVCGMCEDRIERTALGTRGVSSANWDSESKTLELKVSDRFKENRLHYNLASAGHDTREMVAPDPVYNALPACCHYRPDDGHDHAGHDHGTGEHDHALHADRVIGKVTERDSEGSAPLPGANVYWAGTTTGAISDENGFFEISMSEVTDHLVVSYVGYGKDTLKVTEPMAFEVEFNKTRGLEEVQIIYRRDATTFDLDNPFNVQEMHEKELLKAACCNLSESFETNPAVDVSFTDAVTGTRQIEMLGLAGPYVQVTRENMPDIRGLSSLYGLTYVPGPWISGIQLNTGTGSVVNGFESITGQINVELKKPEQDEQLYLNLFGNQGGRMEANLNLMQPVGEKLHTGILLHGKYQPFEIDHNRDGFMDQPAGTNAIFLNRWKYQGENGLEGQFGIKGTFLTNQSGQTGFDHDQPFGGQSFWGAGMNTQRLEAFMKTGKVFPDRPFSSIGFQLSGMTHMQDGFFGRTGYMGEQQSVYSNLIYQGILGNTNHQFRTGTSMQFDRYHETLGEDEYRRNEAVPGLFLEYTYNFLDQLSIVSGIRTDHHNNYGLFFTPRLHVRYAPAEKTVLRAMAGRGQKTASVIAENIGMLASSRQVIIEGTNNGNPYGLEPEVAWNTGISAAQEFIAGNREGLVKLDYYYTWFENQVIANYDRDPGMVVIDNLDGESYSQSIQAQVDYELFTRYDIRLAYRFNDVRSTIDGELLPKIFTPRHRAFLNMAYETMDRWNFDLTLNWQGAKRIPNTTGNPEGFVLDSYSPGFMLVNAQVSKKLSDRLEVYLGGENLANYRQPNPILDAENPFSEYFDASMIWGPVFGRKVYGGLRYRIP
mgnify:CR=1 FL=1